HQWSGIWPAWQYQSADHPKCSYFALRMLLSESNASMACCPRRAWTCINQGGEARRMDYAFHTRSAHTRFAVPGEIQDRFDSTASNTRMQRRMADCIFVTNRGPVEYHADSTGQPQARRGAGGVVSGLLCAAQERRVLWISLAMSDADRAAARQWKDE